MTSNTPDDVVVPPDASPLLRRWAVAALILGLATVFAAALAIGRFALPAYDDFMRATRRWQGDHDLGWWTYTFGYTYRLWQGRWASCGIEAGLLPKVDPTRWYLALIGGVAVVNAAAIYVVARALARGGGLAIVMTLSVLALMWAEMPSVAEAVYWFVGAVENTLPISLAAAVVAVLATGTVRGGTAGAGVATAVLAALAFGICGLHELYGAMFCLALALGTSAAFRSESTRRFAWLTVTLAAVVGLVAVVAAPGNRVRMAVEVHAGGRRPARVLTIAARQLWDNGRLWLFDPKLLAAAGWVAFSPALEAARRPWSSAPRVPWRWVILLGWLAMVAIGFGLPSWAFAGEMPVRTLSGNYAVFAGGLLLSVYAWTRPLGDPPRRRGDRAAADAAVLVFGLSLLGADRLFSVTEDLSHRLRPWHAAVERRFAQLRRSAGREAVVPQLPPLPYQLLGGEIVNDPADYRNRGPVAFFNLKRLTLDPALPGHQASEPEAP